MEIPVVLIILFQFLVVFLSLLAPIGGLIYFWLAPLSLSTVISLIVSTMVWVGTLSVAVLQGGSLVAGILILLYFGLAVGALVAKIERRRDEWSLGKSDEKQPLTAQHSSGLI
jgi:hypothetical protein